MVENSFNIIILDPFEQFITFLNSNRVDIKETCSVSAHRKIQLTYPLDDSNVEKYTEWFKHGNKIYVPETLGMDSCLYVINTEYSIDYWHNNEVSIDAEEVLVEFNYISFAHYTLSNESPPTVNRENLEKWFGQWYSIGEIDPLDNSKKVVNAQGSMKLIDFMKLIEESTERVFRTEYSHTGTVINRTLHLKKEINLRKVANTEFLNLNFNLESLELIKDESNSSIAVAPILKLNQTKSEEQTNHNEDVVGSLVNASTVMTNDTSMTPEEAKSIYQSWLDLEVEYREYVPMIIQKKEGNQEGYDIKAWWYAPFEKYKGDDYISSPNQSNVDYSYLVPYSSTENRINPVPKKLFVETSEKNAQAIYIVLANSLLKKTKSKFTLKVSVKDIQMLLGKSNLGYQLYETLYVLPPGFDYYVPCYITETVKNPHMPGENTITLETDITGTHNQKATEILSSDLIFPAGKTDTKVGGQLIADNGAVVPNAVINVSVRLKNPYDKIVVSKEQVYEFNPVDETYSFTEQEIQKLEKKIRWDVLKNKYMSYNYLMEASNGRIYSVPKEWCMAIYSTRNQAYINSDNPIGSGKFKNSISVHYYENSKTLVKSKDELIYYPSVFYEYIQDIKKSFIEDFHIDPYIECEPVVISSEMQTGAGCLPAAISNLSAKFYNYKTEIELRKIFKTDNSGTKWSDILPGLTQLGYTYSIHDVTIENLKKFVIGMNSGVLLICDPLKLGLDNLEGFSHALIVYDWVNYGDVFKVGVLDSNSPKFNPKFAGKYDVTPTAWYDIDTLLNAVQITEENGELVQTKSNSLKKMIVINNGLTNLPDLVTEEITPAGTFDPTINTYEFKSTEIESAWWKLVNYKCTSDLDWRTISYDLKDTSGTTYKITGDWVWALMESLTYHYHHDYSKKKTLTITASTKQGDSAYFCKRDDAYLPYDPTTKSNIMFPYLIATLCTLNGVLVTPADADPSNLSTETQNIVQNEGQDSFNFLSHAIHDLAPQLNVYRVKFSEENIKKYTNYINNFRNYSLCVTSMVDPSYTPLVKYDSFLIHTHYNDDIKGLYAFDRTSTPLNERENVHRYFTYSNIVYQEGQNMIVVSQLTLEQMEQKYRDRGQK